MERCRDVGFRPAAILRIVAWLCVSGAREIRAAKTIFHVSGWQARHWSADIACVGWFHGERYGGFLSLGTLQFRFWQMAAWFDPNRERRGHGGGVLHSRGRALNGAMLSRGRRFMVSRAVFGLG